MRFSRMMINQSIIFPVERHWTCVWPIRFEIQRSKTSTRAEGRLIHLTKTIRLNDSFDSIFPFSPVIQQSFANRFDWNDLNKRMIQFSSLFHSAEDSCIRSHTGVRSNSDICIYRSHFVRSLHTSSRKVLNDSFKDVGVHWNDHDVSPVGEARASALQTAASAPA